MRADTFLLETLAHFVRADEGPPPGVPARVGAGFETRLATVCADQGITPVVSRSLDRLALPPSISRVTAERLRSHAAAVESETARRLGIVARLCERLITAGVDALIAGDTLAATTYSRATLRPVPVIDFLIHERDIARALAVLEREGYLYPGVHPVFGRFRSEGHISERRAAELVWYHHYIAPLFLTSADGIAVRLRARLIDLGHPAAEEEAWEKRATVAIGKESVAGVCIEDHLIERAVRCGMAAMADLVALVDVGVVLSSRKGDLDWRYVSERTGRSGTRTAVATVVGEVCRLFDLPDSSRHAGGSDLFASGLVRRWWQLEGIDYAELPAPRAGRFRFGLIACGGPVARTRWVWRHLAPRRRWVRNLLGGRPSLWRWLKFLLIARDFPVRAGMPAPRSTVREGSITPIDIKPGKNQ